MKIKGIMIMAALSASLAGACNQKPESTKPESAPALSQEFLNVKNLVDAFAPVEITADISSFSEKEKQLVDKLVEAGKLADKIFWKQSSHESIMVRDSLAALSDEGSKIMLDYVNINYGPFDILTENRRFVGSGSVNKPLGAGFYPYDLTKEEFEAYTKANPSEKEALESQYTVVVRDGQKLKAIPYHEYYTEIKELAQKLDEAAELAENESLKKYLSARAEAIRTSNYFDSDMAWMDINNSNIDIVIGPIENYEDALFNYKTAFEAVVMIKDIEASKELDMFKSHIQDFQSNLPIDKKYIEPVKTDNEILQVVNVAYFGGDCQSGTKTIAAALPNDPNVVKAKGGKKSMYKNMMEAKFDKMVLPIGQTLLSKELIPYIDKKSFTSFVTLHEVSHTLGRGFVFGKKITVRKALQDRYSAIEETKADILSMYNHKHLFDIGILNKEDLKKSVVTYIAGLYRSLRFGLASAHGNANLIQLNFLREKGAIITKADGTITYDENKFFEKVGELARIILTLQAEGNYEQAGKIIEKYTKTNAELAKDIDRLKAIPRDINTTYSYKK